MNEKLTIGNIYKQLENLGYSSNETIFGTELIIKYIKQETKLSDDKENFMRYFTEYTNVSYKQVEKMGIRR